MERGKISLRNETLTPLTNYPLRRGLPLPPGQVREADQVRIVDTGGKTLPSAGRILQRRPDGSIEWLCMDVLLDLGPQEKAAIYIEPKPGTESEPPPAVTVTDDGTEVTLANGISSVTVSRAAGAVLRRVVINGFVFVDGQRVELHAVDAHGKIHRASLHDGYSVAVTHANALTATVTLSGKHAARDGATFLDFDLQLTLVAGNPDLRLEHTFYCREAVDAKVLVRELALTMPTTMDPAATKLIRQSHHGHDWTPRTVEVAENIEIVASSVGNIDRYRELKTGHGVSHPCAGGSVFIRNAASLKIDWQEVPFHMRPGAGSGFRADLQISGTSGVVPVLGWTSADFTAVTAFEHFRQLHPKAISIDEDELVFAFWPDWATPMELVQGVSKSHVFWLTGEPRRLSMGEVESRLYRWEYGYAEPIDIAIDPAWLAHCEVLDCHHLLPYEPAKYPLLENLIEAAPGAGNPARHTYDRQAATGMFHFGDIVSADASTCTNNEDDIEVMFPFLHYLRTGHTYAWDYGKEAARHYMEVDFCEWSTDPRQRHGLIPHTGHHFIGNVYPSHQWSEGLLAYYYLSGDERARRAVIGVAENHTWWVYNKTDMLCSDGREAGVPLVNLAAGYRLTGDQRYIDAARHICKNFFERWTDEQGRFRYPNPVGTADHPHKLINGYGDWSSMAGLYKIWEQTGDSYYSELALKLMEVAIKPENFSVNDCRTMDFYAAWAYGKLSGDMDRVIELLQPAIPMLLRRGGHPLRRLHFLNELHRRGLIDDAKVGSRAGAI